MFNWLFLENSRSNWFESLMFDEISKAQLVQLLAHEVYPRRVSKNAGTGSKHALVNRHPSCSFRIYQKLGVPNMDDLDGPKLMPGIPSHGPGICVCRRCSWKIRRIKKFWFEQMSHKCVPPRQNLLVKHLGGWRPCPMSPAAAWRPASLNHDAQVRPLFVLFWS